MYTGDTTVELRVHYLPVDVVWRRGKKRSQTRVRNAIIGCKYVYGRETVCVQRNSETEHGRVGGETKTEYIEIASK